MNPSWGHNKIRPEEKRLANLAGYYDTYREKEIIFLSGRMSQCNNSMSNKDRKMRIQCEHKDIKLETSHTYAGNQFTYGISS